MNSKYTVLEGATWNPYLEEAILRGVHLELLPLLRAEDIYVRTDVTRKPLRAEGTLTNGFSQAMGVTLVPRLSSATGDAFSYPRISAQKVTLAAGETRAASLGQVP